MLKWISLIEDVTLQQTQERVHGGLWEALAGSTELLCMNRELCSCSNPLLQAFASCFCSFAPFATFFCYLLHIYLDSASVHDKDWRLLDTYYEN